MAEPSAFGQLVDLAPREAWGHEAHAFTPWLAANIDRLGEAVGMELEPTDTEVRVERFAADILARDPTDGSVVLIENQLEATDHTHLGQILTYLAGLDARAVIWIAPEFREPHLSAVRWLNQHTAEDFSFFAVRLRVVRIGESPLAPVFEVLEKPNGWERRLTKSKRGAEGGSAVGERYAAFWAHVTRRDPSKVEYKSRKAYAVTHATPEILVNPWIGLNCSGIYVRGPYGAPDAGAASLTQFGDGLANALDVPLGGPERFLSSRGPGSIREATTWDAAADWLIAARRRYADAIREAMAGREPVEESP